MVVRTELFETQTNFTYALPPRLGTPPRTARVLPHLQLDQLAPPEIAEELIERSLALPYVRSTQSRMAAPKSRALCLQDDFASGPPDAFIDSHEFCHLHPLPESSIHLTLPQDLRELAVQLGWAEPHLVSRLGSMPPTLVLVYAPRNMEELSTVFRLVRCSYQFARGV